MSLRYLLVFLPSIALAEPLSKEACIDAHSRGQDAREQGRLTLARKLFLSCAQSSCPVAVQTDCARFADDLTSLQPTVNFVARDAGGNDLPNTTVYVDGVLVATVIDGRPVEIDPGSHNVRFSNAGRDETVTVVIGSGEKGRTVQARFGGAQAARATADKVVVTRRPRTTHPKGALALAIGGGAVTLTGAAIALYGNAQIPSQCSLSAAACAAAPGDPVFAEAAAGARTVNLGLGVAAAGALVATGGLVWYFTGAKREAPVQAWVKSDGGGVAVRGRF